MILRAFLIDLKCRCLQSGLADLEKHKILPFLLTVDFLHTFKITHFLRFLEDFENHQNHMLNWLNAFYFI